MAITWLADALRAAGITVVEHAGWQTRAVSGSWSPMFGIVHATAAPDSQSDADQIRIVRDGRADLDGPIANACVDRSGRWHVLAAGRCNTTIAGTAGPYEGKGNTYALGVEACHSNQPGAPWPAAQYQAYVRGWAAIAKRMGWGPDRLRGHKEHTPGHKTDPTFSMATFRADVARVLAGETTEDDMAVGEDIYRLLHDGLRPEGQAQTANGGVPIAWLPRMVSEIKAGQLEQKLRDEALLAAVRDDADRDAILAAVEARAAELVGEVNQVAGETVAALGEQEDPQVIANALRVALGDKAAAVGALLTAPQA